MPTKVDLTDGQRTFYGTWPPWLSRLARRKVGVQNSSILTARTEAEARRASRVMSVAAEFFGESNVGCVVRRKIIPKPPNVRQENEVRIARYAQIEHVLDRLIGTRSRNRPFPHQSPQDLRHLKVEKVRSMKRFAVRVNSGVYLLPHGGLKKPVNRRGRIQDDHRASRSSRTRRAVSS